MMGIYKFTLIHLAILYIVTQACWQATHQYVDMAIMRGQQLEFDNDYNQAANMLMSNIANIPNDCWLLGIEGLSTDTGKMFWIRFIAKDRGSGLGPTYDSIMQVFDGQTGDMVYCSANEDWGLYELSRFHSMWSYRQGVGSDLLMVKQDLSTYLLLTLSETGQPEILLYCYCLQLVNGVTNYDPVCLIDFNGDSYSEVLIKANHAVSIIYSPNRIEMKEQLGSDDIGVVSDNEYIIVSLNSSTQWRFSKAAISICPDLAQ